MKPTNFFSIRLLLPLLLIFVSCGENSEDLQHGNFDNDSLILMGMEIFEDLNQSSPDLELSFTISLDECGKAIIRFCAEDKSPSEAQNLRGVFKVNSLEEEEKGIECSTPVEMLNRS